MSFLDQFSAILFDMNGTFMFGHDRFEEGEDYWSTYHGLGGRTLSRRCVTRSMATAYEAVMRDYDRAERFEAFPSMAEVFRAHTTVPKSELTLMDRVFAAHEIGHVPADHANFLRKVAKSHHLGIVSNICAQPEPWLTKLRASGLLDLFQTVVFSSEGREIKPSPRIFERGLANLAPNASVVFIGDSLERDIIPAKSLGLATVWIAPLGSQHAAADVVVRQLPDLDQAC